MGGNFWENLEKFKLPIILSLVGLVLIIGGVFASGINKQKPKSYPKASLVDTAKTITVDVSGAVKIPGVYKLKEEARIEDAVAAAGGFNDLANEEFISKSLNLAQKLVDGSKVYIPSKGESAVSTTSAQTGAVAGISSKVNINTASQSEIEALSGIGPVTASKIISDRPYQVIEELVGKKVVSKAVFEKIKDEIVVY